MHSRRFPAKLLLFGEYTLLSGSRALAIPVNKWGGRLEVTGGGVVGTEVAGTGHGLERAPLDAGQEQRTMGDLVTFAEYLLEQKLLSQKGGERLREDLVKGLSFISNIPQGYGVGSSGALCAAFWDRYGPEVLDIPLLRSHLADMENFFHGTSSGLDPLVSYLGSPILYEANNYCQVALPGNEKPRVFLLDSGGPHDTGALVARYRTWLGDSQFQHACLSPLLRHVDHAIQFLLEAHWEPFCEHLQAISLLQHRHFEEMIPAHVMPLWEKSLSQPEFGLKLCGAGGGGYFLGFALSGAEEVVGEEVLWIDW